MVLNNSLIKLPLALQELSNFGKGAIVSSTVSQTLRINPKNKDVVKNYTIKYQPEDQFVLIISCVKYE